MLTAQLEESFRAAIGEPAGSGREESIQFAVAFARLLARILQADEITGSARDAMFLSIGARTDLNRGEIGILLDLALAPENRVAIDDDDLRAFGGRFGVAEEEALRKAVDEEVDLGAFARAYGEAEALLLLDALFDVCAVDGQIDRDEIGRLQSAADQLGIDPMLVSALFRKHDVRHASGDFAFELTGKRYVIGSSKQVDVVLPDPQVAARHAELVRIDGAWRVRDLRSGRPTLVNGSPVATAPFSSGDQLRVGSYVLTLGPQGESLQAFGTSSFSALSVRNLSRTIGRTTLLDQVSFTVFSGEVVAVVGPSGAGKTTLLNAIAGIAPADKGQVLFDGQNFHRLLAADRSAVGIVPQDDVVHAELTVEEALYYSGRLRFPSDVSRRDVRGEVDRVLAELDIEHIRRSRIGDAVRRGISGGQRKRVNLGQELLTRSTRVLFLDEPTSGLDPQTAQDIVSLIRQLADGGRMVFLVTHDVTPAILSMIDHLMVLAPGGRLAWFGPPDDACRYFDVDHPDGIFAKLSEKSPEAWGEGYRGSAASRKFVATREHLLGLGAAADATRVARPVPTQRSGLRNFLTLTARYFRVKRRDLIGMFVLMSQAPVLGLFMWIVFPAPDPPAMFMLALSSLWFGASGSVRELIADRTIWRREARVGLGTLPYVLSKLVVLGMITGIQCVTLATMCFVLLPMYGEYGFSWFWLSFVTCLTGWIGMALGLLISASTASSEAAVGTLPLVLIPQITFSGLIVKVKEMGLVATAMSYLMVVRYSFEAIIKTGDRLTEPLVGGQRERVARPLSGVLYNLGFKQSGAADDMGISFVALVSVLLSILGTLVLLTLWRTRSTREGN
jgi:ABC-type multidrug transport system ATPase subunit